MDIWVMFAGLLGVAAVYAIAHYYLEQKRTEEFENLAVMQGYEYLKANDEVKNDLTGRDIRIFERGYRQKVKHCFEIAGRFGPLNIFEMEFMTGSGKSRKVHHYHVVWAQSEQAPGHRFSVMKETMWMNFKPKLGFQDKDINFDDYPQFSKRYFLTGDDETQVRESFNDDLTRWFEGLTSDYSVDSIQDGVVISKEGKLKAEHLDELRGRAEELIAILGDQAKASAFDW